MELKGQASKKLKPEDRAKKEATVKRMSKVREKDNVHLRTKIDKKLEHYSSERQKAVDVIKAYEDKISAVTATLQRIEGAILALQDVKTDESDV
jgi:hypothetical protein